MKIRKDKQCISKDLNTPKKTITENNFDKDGNEVSHIETVN